MLCIILPNVGSLVLQKSGSGCVVACRLCPNLTKFWLSISTEVWEWLCCSKQACLVVYFDQSLALVPLEPWSSCAVVLGLSSCKI